jgi:1-acyl-sn-glycerol-3-phosphate acyltransferase
MKSQPQPRLGQKPNIVQGGLEVADPKDPRIWPLRLRTYEKIRTTILGEKDEILASEDPLQEYARRIVEAFCEEITFEGDENIPEKGKLIVAPNHPFGSPDAMTLLHHIIKTQPHRPWNFAGSTTSFKHLVPELVKEPYFQQRTTPITKDSQDVIRNGEDAIFKALSFMNKHENPMFIICPEGHTVTFQNRIGMPFPGFAAIARATRAQILPVLFTGSADLKELRYKIHGKILPPFEPSRNDNQTRRKWYMRLRAAALGCNL